MDDSTLKSFVLSTVSGTDVICLHPPFSPGIREYDALVKSDIEAIKVRAMPNESEAFVQVSKADADQAVRIQEGANDIQVRVDALDGSSSVYVVRVQRASASDATLRELRLSTGTLTPAFQRNECRYVLSVDTDAPSVTCTPVPYDPKAAVHMVDLGAKITDMTVQLFMGETPLAFKVTSANQTTTAEYHVTVSKEKLGYRLRPASETSTVKNVCSVCGCLAFRQRQRDKASNAECSHQFCETCLYLLRRAGETCEVMSGGQLIGYGCPLCADHSIVVWVDNPRWAVDATYEAAFMGVLVNCPFSQQGCHEAVEMGNVFQHVRNCTFIPGSCSECQVQNAIPKSHLEDGKHKEKCVQKCACGRNVRTIDIEWHTLQCQTEPPKLPGVTCSPWESALINKRLAPASTDDCRAAAEAKMEQYIKSLTRAKHESAETLGLSTSNPDTVLLDEICALYATAIDYQWTGTPDALFHLALGRALEESILCKQLFPPPTPTKSSEELASAADGSMNEEVDGLLLQLGIPPSATDATKLRAMEAEYQRLKGLGLSDQAAEVQALYTWKIARVASAGPGAGWNLGMAAGPTEVSTDYERVLEKYQHAVACSPRDAYANFHLGQALLKSNRFEDAINHLRTAEVCKPNYNAARAMLGVALVSANRSFEEVQEGLRYLAGWESEYRASIWVELAQAEKGTRAEPEAGALLDDYRSFWGDVLGRIMMALARGYYRTGQAEKAVNTLADLLYLCPEGVRRMRRGSIAAAASSMVLCEALDLSMRALSQMPGETSKARIQGIAVNLLTVQDILVSRKDEAGCRLLERIAQTVTALFPGNAKYLAVLGQAQLDVYDMQADQNKDIKLLEEAEQSFSAAIAADGGDIVAESQKLVHQRWWAERETEARICAEARERQSVRLDEGEAGTNKTRTAKKPVASTKPVTKSALPQTPLAKTSTPRTTAPRTTTTRVQVAQATAKASREGLKPSKTETPEPKVSTTALKRKGGVAAGPAVTNKSTITKPRIAAGGKAALKTDGDRKKMEKPAAVSADNESFSANSKLAKDHESSPATIAPNPAVNSVQQVLDIGHAKNSEPLLGLARALSRRLTYSDETRPADWETERSILLKKIESLYQRVVTLSPDNHDAYIEFSSFLEAHLSLEAAADVLARFPFDEGRDASQDDLYIHGEIARAFMKLKRYRDPVLTRSLIAEGRAGGIGVLSKYVEQLDQAGESQVLMEVYAGVNRKRIDDPDLQAFFKARYWI
ncbi:hypothetical protein BC832DRAFT_551269 [Gaertneriomyces semiglobifer]|nr:hypothetical protein BC832DRAFT_551269 [Gaertneriomyces semiglobifer]